MKTSRFLPRFSRGAFIVFALVALLVLRWTRVGAFLMGILIIHSIFNAPISFYGRVQDQFGRPIPGATVKYDVVDKFWEDGSKYTGSSDANGLFSISGIGGAGMLVGEFKDAQRHFDWTCDVVVPGGGLLERTDENVFVAPEQGYSPSSHSWSDRGGLTPRWTPFFQQQYFVRMPDGRYGRISVEVLVGGWSFAVLESVLNPTPGSRNLEYDPKPAVKIP